MNTPIIRINPAVNVAQARAAYMRDGFVQVPDIFEPALAEYLAQLVENLNYGIAFQGEDGRPVMLKPEEMQAQAKVLGPRIQKMIARTGSGYGFLYQAYPLISAYVNGRDPGHPIHKLTEWLNGEFVEFSAYITDQPQVAKADGQATRYQPGDFIGLHDDVGTEDSDRLTAYTLGFTRRWRSDWGGQLVFHDEKGDISRGYVPRFNTLTLFKVPQLHSVSQVASYAQMRRHSIVGWLRNHRA